VNLKLAFRRFQKITFKLATLFIATTSGHAIYLRFWCFFAKTQTFFWF